MYTKRLLTLLLTICMVLSCVFPAAAAAPTRITGSAHADTAQTVDTTTEAVDPQTPASDAVDAEKQSVSSDRRHVLTGSEASRETLDADADVPENAGSVDTESVGQIGGWAAEQVDADVDLTGVNSSVEELKALSQQYAPEEIVTAFVVLEDAPLSEAYSSQLQVPGSVLEAAARKQTAVLDSIERSVGSVEVVYQFHFLTNSLVIETAFENLAEIAMLKGVASVFVSPVFYPASTDAEQMTVSSGQMTNVDDVWKLNGSGFTGAGMTIAVLDTGLDLDHPSFAADPQLTEDSWTKESVQEMLDGYYVEGFDGNLLNAVERYKGTLTANDLYYSAKVPFRFNYALGTTSVVHNDTLGDHGTHVSGIAAANEVEGTGVVGMAPDAQLIAMKVFNPSTGGANLFDFVAALEDCILLGVDVANLSLGSAAGFTDSGYAEIDAIFQRIEGTDMIVNIAAGNDGTSASGSLYGEQAALTSSIDNSTVGSPSTYRNVMSIASVDNSYVMADYFTLGDGETKVFYQPSVEYLYGYTTIGLQEMLADQTVDYVVIDGLGYAEDFFDADGNSLVQDKIAVVKRGTLNFSDKINNAVSAGAVGVFIWNNVSEDIYSFGLSTADTDNNYPVVPVALISLEDGEIMAQCENKTLTVATEAALRINTTGGQISSFSSWGTAPDLRLVPDLSGIGGNVYSCYDGGQYGLMSGTSMATPQVCGVTALVKQYLKEKTNLDIDNELVQALMMSTAKPIVGSESKVETSPRQQGAGLVDALTAVTSGAYLTVNGGRPKAELGSKESGIYSFTFEVHNFSDKTKTYRLDSSLLTEDFAESAIYDGVTYMAGMDCALDGRVLFSQDVVSVAPGETAAVTATIVVSAKGRQWINEHFENGNYVEGYVYLKDSASEGGVDLSLPFLGFYQDWSDAPVFDDGYWYDNSCWAASVEGVQDTISAEEYWNILWVNMGVSDNDWMLGMNPYSGAIADENGNVRYSSDNNVLAPNGDGIMDKISDYYLSLLRNARYVWLTYTDEDGNILDQQTLEYLSKTMYNSSYGSTVPTVYSWYYNSKELYDFTDAEGKYLPDGTKLTLTISAVIDYDLDSKVTTDDDGNVIPVAPDDSIVIPITIDTAAPVLDTDRIVETTDDEGNKYLTFTITEAHPATMALMNPAGTQIIEQVFDYEMTANPDGTWTVTMDITGYGDDLLVTIGDYGYNEASYQVHRSQTGGNDPDVDMDALYAYQVYNATIYYYYGWDYMFGWTTVDTDEGTVEMINSDAYEYYAINAAEYVDGYVFAVDAGNNFLYMKPGLWNRTIIRNLGYNIIDLAFDDVTDTLYAIISDSDSETYGLGTIDLLTGELTVVEDYGGKYYAPWAMTFVDGQLYCCKYYYSGFYQVDLETYAITNVMTTDEDGNEVAFSPMSASGYSVNPYYGQSMTYSKDDGMIYWLYCNSSSSTELLTIDPEKWTCEAKRLGSTEYVGALTLEDTDYQIPASAEVTDLAISEEETILAIGATTELTVYALPWNAPAEDIVWVSDDDSVATVENGVVKAVGVGRATITASCGDVIAQCKVTVFDISGEMVAFNYSGDADDYGYWQTIDFETMEGVNIEGTNQAEFLAADYNGHDGYIYGFDTSFNSWKMNAETGEVTQLKGTGYVVDMAYDYSTGIMYAIVDGSTELYAMNMHTGKLVSVADTNHYTSFATLACDLDGYLYAIDLDGGLWMLTLYESTDEGGGDDGGIGGFEPLMQALDDEYDILIDDDFGIIGEEEGSETILAVDMMPMMELDVSVYGYLYYAQNMCYNYEKDALIWCYTDGDTFRWIDLYGDFVYDMGSVKPYTMPQYFGMHMIPENIPELNPVGVESITAENMFLLVGGSGEPELDVEPVNVNQDYQLVYEVVANIADDGTDSEVARVEDGKIVACKAGVAYVDILATDDDGEELGYTTIAVTVKNATSSELRMYMAESDYWISVDQYNTDNMTPYGNAIYDGTAYFMYSAEYVDATGYIYGYGFDQNGWDTNFHFITFERDTMSAISAVDMGDEFPFVYDLAYDYSTGTMYALAGTSSGVVAIYYVDLQTGTLVKACSLDQTYLNMAVDAEGTIYVMTQTESSYIEAVESSGAQLFTVDPKTGESEYVLDTGVASPYLSSLAYDYDTGYLYWTPYEGLYLIDVENYSVNCVGALVSQNEALMVLNDTYPTVPESLQDASLTVERAEVHTGSTVELQLFIQPATVQTTTTWYSSDETVATVDENGVVTGVSSGMTTISAVVSDGTKSICCSCLVYVYGDEDYFLSYNATDMGFSMIDRLDPTNVTNLTEGEDEAAVSSMIQIDGVIYAYDVEGNFFSTTADDNFVRSYIGSCGIDLEQYALEGEDSDERKDVYTTGFKIYDMVCYNDKLLALGVVTYDVFTQYFYNGEVSYEYEWKTERYGGCSLYEVDMATGELTQLCIINAEDGGYMNGAKLLTVDGNGRLYVYTTYNDHICALDPANGNTSTVSSLQSLSVYGEENSIMGMTYDEATNNIYLLITTNGNYYRLFKMAVDTCMINEVNQVGEVILDGWSYIGDAFHGLVLNSTVTKPDHVHSYTEVSKAATCVDDGYHGFACECGDALFMDVIPAHGVHDFQPDADGKLVCVNCGEVKDTEPEEKDCDGGKDCVSHAFTDLSKIVSTNSGIWWHEAVDYVIGKDLMHGISDTLFVPNAFSNRAMVAIVLYRLEGSPDVSGLENPFSDVTEDWYMDAIVWAAENGIVNGYEDGTFRPLNNTSRQELFTMLYRYADYKGMDVTASAELNGFTDAKDVQQWAMPAVSWAKAVGLMTGYEDNTIRPTNSVSRAELAVLLYRWRNELS